MTSTTTHHRRAASLIAVLALLAALVPLGTSATAQEGDPTPRGIFQVCPPPDMTAPVSDLFNDISQTVHRQAINCLAQYGMTQGYRGIGGPFGPNDHVTRGQMATFLRTFVEIAIGEPLPVPPVNRFTDTPGHRHEGSIEAIALAGIAQGYPDNTYRPGQLVRRGQMATYLRNAVNYAITGAVDSTEPPPTTRDFFDDDNGTIHEGNTNRLADIGVIAGVGGRQFAPFRFVTRAQMATFLMQTADYLDERRVWPPTVQPREIFLSPVSDTNVATMDHVVTAFVIDFHRRVTAGWTIAFEVWRDVGDPQRELVASGTAESGSFGQAAFVYEGPNFETDDVIIACYDSNGDGLCTGEEITATATKNWVLPPFVPVEVGGIDAEPAFAINPVGDEHHVTATVVDNDGEPTERAQVLFEVRRGDLMVFWQYQATNEDGQVVLTYRSFAEGTEQITACTNADGSRPATCPEADFSVEVTKIWAVPPASIDLVPTTAWNPVGTGHAVTAIVRDDANNRLANIPVRFEVYRQGEPGDPPPGDIEGPIPALTQTTPTDGAGQATLAYTGPPFVATDVIVGCVLILGEEFDDDEEVCAEIDDDGALQPTDERLVAVSGKQWGALALTASAFGLHLTVDSLIPIVDLGPLPTASVDMPPPHHQDEEENVIVDVPLSPLVDVEVLTAWAFGDLFAGVARSRGEAAEVDALDGNIRAELVVAQANAVCPMPGAIPVDGDGRVTDAALAEQVSEGTVLVGLELGGAPIPIDPGPNTVIAIPELATVVIHEVLYDADANEFIVRGLNVEAFTGALTDLLHAHLIVAEARVSIDCGP